MNQTETQSLTTRILKLMPILNEKQRRLYLSVEAQTFGRGGIRLVSEISGYSKTTINDGIKELNKEIVYSDRSRKKGGGRKSITTKYPHIEEKIKSLVDSTTSGDPMSLLLYTSKSTRKISDALKKEDYKISHDVVGKILRKMGYSLQANKKMIEGKDHPDRDAQFRFINETAKDFVSKNNPVISIDTKKKELIGNFKNNGQEYALKGQAPQVNVYDFQEELFKAIPYGVYDIVRNEGWVNVGVNNDTAEFAVESIRRWWKGMGKSRYPDSKKLMITCDGGGSNGSRVRLFKVKLQQLANEIGLEIQVCHFPPGTSKWNKIEHRLFSFISQNWRAKPLLDLVTVVNLIAATTTKTGLKVSCEIDENEYQKGIKISNEELDSLNIIHHEVNGKWNYVIKLQK